MTWGHRHTLNVSAEAIPIVPPSDARGGSPREQWECRDTAPEPVWGRSGAHLAKYTWAQCDLRGPHPVPRLWLWHLLASVCFLNELGGRHAKVPAIAKMCDPRPRETAGPPSPERPGGSLLKPNGCRGSDATFSAFLSFYVSL